MKIGILSDTHGLLRPEVLEALSGSAHILHCGDIGGQTILDRLEEIAPVMAVRGNNDKEWAEGLPCYLDTELDGLRVYMTHKKKDLPEDLSPYDLVLTGHTHAYASTLSESGALLLDPGSCGPRRFGQPITLAVLEIRGGEWTIERIDVPHTPAQGR